MGGTMRLGADPVKLHDGTRVRELYDEPVVYERHRHRYEVNNHLRRRLESRRPGLLRHLARRAARRGDRARARRCIRSSSPRSTTPSSSRGPSARRRCSGSSSAPRWPTRARRRRASRRAVRRDEPGPCGVSRGAALVRRASDARARATARDVRDAVPRSRARPATSAPAPTGSTPSCAGRDSRWTRTTPGRRPASDAGNLLARIPGSGPESILLCAHMDTVPPRAAIEPVLVDGGWDERQRRDPRRRQQGGGGGDARAGAPADRRAPAAAGRASSCCSRSRRRPACTAPRRSTSPACAASSAMSSITPRRSARSSSRRRPTTGSSPSLRGRAAHAGIRPEDGRSAIVAAARAIAAMRLGRLDAETTANVGVDRRRNRDQRRARALPDRGRGARASTPSACEQVVHRDHRPPPGRRQRRRVRPRRDRPADVHRLPDQAGGPRSWPSPSGRCARAATSRRRSSPAARSDANAFASAGFPCLNLANGTERNHQPDERVSVDALEGMLEVAIALTGRGEPARPAGEARMSGFERIGSKVNWEGTIVRRRRSSVSATTTARRSRARRSGTPARSGSSPSTTPTYGSRASRARRSARPPRSRSPRASSSRG